MWPHNYQPSMPPFTCLQSELRNSSSAIKCPSTKHDEQLGHAFLTHRLAKYCELEHFYDGRPLDRTECDELMQIWEKRVFKYNHQRNEELHKKKADASCVFRTEEIATCLKNKRGEDSF